MVDTYSYRERWKRFKRGELPFAVHIPGYDYAGPGTHDYSKVPVNKLDAAARIHDIEYRGYKYPYTRFNAADQKLIDVAYRIGTPEAWVVWTFFKAKKIVAPYEDAPIKFTKYDKELGKEIIKKMPQYQYSQPWFMDLVDPYGPWRRAFPNARKRKQKYEYPPLKIKKMPSRNLPALPPNELPVPAPPPPVVRRPDYGNWNLHFYKDSLGNMSSGQYKGLKWYKKKNKNKKGKPVDSEDVYRICKKLIDPLQTTRHYTSTVAKKIMTKSGFRCFEVIQWANDKVMMDKIAAAKTVINKTGSELYLVTGTTTAPVSEDKYRLYDASMYVRLRNNSNVPLWVTIYAIIPKADVTVGVWTNLSASTQEPCASALYEGWKNVMPATCYDFAGGQGGDAVFPDPATSQNSYNTIARVFAQSDTVTVFDSRLFCEAFTVLKKNKRYLSPGEEIHYHVPVKGGILSKDKYYFDNASDICDARIAKCVMVELEGVLSTDDNTVPAQSITLDPAAAGPNRVVFDDVSTGDAVLDVHSTYKCSINSFDVSETFNAMVYDTAPINSLQGLTTNKAFGVFEAMHIDDAKEPAG